MKKSLKRAFATNTSTVAEKAKAKPSCQPETDGAYLKGVLHWGTERTRSALLKKGCFQGYIEAPQHEWKYY